MDSTRNGERLVHIFVDADACPVVGIVEEIAEKYNIPTTLLCDTNHILYSDYSEVIVVGAGADAVDYKLISICHKGDVVVTQDYGVAAMALGKGAYAIHQSGKWYTNENIDQMLMERHLNKKARRSSHKNHMKGPRRRTEEDDVRFAQSFEKLVAGFKDIHTGKIEEVMLIKNQADLDAFKKMYGIDGEIEKEY
ncbi:MAG: YaiI/YqxD family protein [Roseburia inulinivorans]|uniref:YaiI/YqxD family protein n=1 Tax=Roseburia inulinivorans TaxID=360807 RepID=UPI003993F25E